MDALTIIGIIGIIIGIVAGIVQIIDYLQKQREQRALATRNKPLSAAAPHSDDTPSHLAYLRQQLTNLFSEGELRNLCFDLGVDYESLPARSKDGKARELITHIQRNSRLPELIRMGRQLRPQAHWPDLPQEPTPDSFSKPTIPHNLPRRSPFVGREAEKAQVHEALLTDGYLVSIEGIGGIGKSSLTLQVAHECLEASTDDGAGRNIATFEGLIWVTAKDQELNLDGMLNTVARTLEYVGIAQQPIEEKQIAVQKLLRSKRCLLILDNYETVTDDGVHRFLRELPEPSKALITTRIQNTPQAHIVALKGMTQAEALTLIRSDGQRLGLPAVAQADDGVLLRLYKATGGAPLALKWALGQIKQKGQSLDIVLTALHEARGAIFETMFARAWDLLSNDAQRVLLVMPIFATSADRLDIEAASAIQGLALDEALGQLVEMTLIEITSHLEILEQRYNVHPLTRAFALDQLEKEASTKHNSLSRLANYYSAKGQETKGDWGSTSGFHWFETELANILVVLDWTGKTQQFDLTISVFEPLMNFLGTRGYWQERVKYCLLALDAATQIGDYDRTARFQNDLAVTFYRQGKYEKAQPLYEMSIQTHSQLGRNVRAARTTLNLIKLMIAQQNIEGAISLFGNAIQFLSADEYHDLAPGLITTQARIALAQGQLDQARQLFENALELITDNPRYFKLQNSISSRKIDLGHIALAQNDLIDKSD